MPFKDLVFHSGLAFADQFIHNPIQSAVVQYARDRATDYIADKVSNFISNMPRPDPFSRKRRGPPLINPRPNYRFGGRRKGTDSRYTGSFPYPSKPAYKDKSRAPTNGSTGMIEGNIDALTGQNVAYIGFSSIVRTMSSLSTRTYLANPVFHMAVAILRKYLKIHYKVDLESIEQTWRDLNIYTVYTLPNPDTLEQAHPDEILLWYKKTPYTSGSAGITPTIDWYKTDPVNLPWGGIPISLNDSIMNTALDIARVLLDNYEFGATPSPDDATYEFYGISMREKPWANYVDMKSVYRVDNLKIHIRTYNTIYIQNQTQSDGNSLSTDVIDTNPIKGRIFMFKDPLPVCRYVQRIVDPPTGTVGKQWKLMHDTNGDGVIYPDADVSGDTGTYNNQEWAQIPSTDMFLNCKSYSTVSLEPGEMKKFKFGFSFDGYITRFLTGLNLTGLDVQTYQTKAGELGNKALGTSVLFAFDKRLSTGAGGVELAVQRHSSCFVQLGKRKKIGMYPMRYREQAIAADDTTPV